MKSILQWKFIPLSGFTLKLPWLSSAAPLFHYSEGKIRVNNKAKNIIGVKLGIGNMHFQDNKEKIYL